MLTKVVRSATTERENPITFRKSNMLRICLLLLLGSLSFSASRSAFAGKPEERARFRALTMQDETGQVKADGLLAGKATRQSLVWASGKGPSTLAVNVKIVVA